MSTLQQALSALPSLDNLEFDDDAGEPQVLVGTTPEPEPEPVAKPVPEPEAATPSKTTCGAGSPRYGTLRPQIWAYLVAHPTVTSLDIAEALDLDTTTVAATLKTFIDADAAERVKVGPRFVYQATRSRYPGRGRPTQQTTVKPAPAPAPAPTPVTATVTPEFVSSTQAFINQLNAYQAKAVYDELKKVFGDSK
jgi:hypothetical protein